MRYCLTIIGVLASSASASEPVDYVGYAEKAEKIAVMATSVQSCKRLGFVTDAAGVQSLSEITIAEAVRSGMEVTMAYNLMNSALKSEDERMSYLTNIVKNSGGSQKEVDKFLDFWLKRCENLSKDSISEQYFKYSN